MLSERDTSFFRPLWIRLLVTAICAGWFGLEVLYSHDQLWMGLTGIATVYCVWNFFIKFPKATPAPAKDDTKN